MFFGAYTCTTLRYPAPPSGAGVVQCRCRDQYFQDDFCLLFTRWSRYVPPPACGTTRPTDYLLQSLDLFHQFFCAGYTIIDIPRLALCVQQERGRDAHHAPPLRKIRPLGGIDLDHL